MERFKNGLTPEQVQKAKEKFDKVNLKAICAKACVKSSVVYNILRDRNNRLDLLALVLEEADNELKRRESFADSLPL